MEENVNRSTQTNNQATSISRDAATETANRPRFSARDRIRQLLGRTLSRGNNDGLLPRTNPQVFTISSEQYQQQPLAWHVETPTVGLPPPYQPSSSFVAQPPFRTHPGYPVIFPPPPYFTRQMGNGTETDVDEWSRADRHRSSTTLSRPHTAAPSVGRASIPGEFPREQDVQPPTGNPTPLEEWSRVSVARSAEQLHGSNPNVNSDTAGQDHSVPQTSEDVHSSSISLVSRNINLPSTPPLTESEDTSVTIDSQATLSVTLGTPNARSRPVSSTNLPTPGNRASADIPGILCNVNTPDDNTRAEFYDGLASEANCVALKAELSPGVNSTLNSPQRTNSSERSTSEEIRLNGNSLSS